MDQARAFRAKKDIHNERDSLLTHADRRIDIQKYLPDDGKDRARAVLLTLLLFIAPLFSYTTVILAWFFVYHSSLVRFCALFACCLALSGAAVAHSYKSISGKERKWLRWLGVFSAQAAVVALILGFFVYFRNLVFYWHYQEMRTYTNVAAAQDDEAFKDGSMFLFTEDSRLDTQRAVGFKSRWTGETYCVAPVVDMTMSAIDPIYYWAIGSNCCAARADFHCSDSKDPTTRSALVALQPGEIVKPWMRWATIGSDYSRYLEAVQLEAATYVTQAAENPTFMFWSRDPVALKDSFYNNGVDLAVKASFTFLPLLLIGIFFVSWTLIPPQRLEGVIRYTK